MNGCPRLGLSPFAQTGFCFIFLVCLCVLASAAVSAHEDFDYEYDENTRTLYVFGKHDLVNEYDELEKYNGMVDVLYLKALIPAGQKYINFDLEEFLEPIPDGIALLSGYPNPEWHQSWIHAVEHTGDWDFYDDKGRYNPYIHNLVYVLDYDEEEGRSVANGACGGGVVYLFQYGHLEIAKLNSGNGVMMDFGLKPQNDQQPPWDCKPPWTYFFFPGQDNYQITTVTIGVGVKNVGAYAFFEMQSLQNVSFASLAGASSVEKIGACAFKGCTSLESVDIGKYPLVKEIGSEAFANCVALKSLDLGSATSLVSIGDHAFENCSSLEHIAIPCNVDSSWGDWFKGCSNLRWIDVDPHNVRYSSVGGVLFENEGKNLVYYPMAMGNKYTIPDTVEYIGPLQFDSKFTELTFPSNLREVSTTQFTSINFFDEKHERLEPTQDNLREYTFIGSGDGNLYRTAKIHTVTFDPEMGRCDVESMDTNVYGMLDEYPSAYCSGHQFLGWSELPGDLQRIVPNDFVYLRDTTIYACYSGDVTEHTVTYDISGGSGKAPADLLLDEGTTFKIASYSGTKAGYEFFGWSYDGSRYWPGDDMVMGKDDIQFIAVWVSKGYHRVTYEVEGGSEPAPAGLDIAEEQTFTVQNYAGTRSGDIFDRWYYNGNLYSPGDTVKMGTEDICFVAFWTKKPYHHVTYDIAGGTGFIPKQEDVREDQTFTVKESSAYRTGYHFYGWTYAQKMYQPGDSILMGQSDIVLQAYWVNGEVHQVKYDVNGGDLPAPATVDVIEGFTFSIQSYSGSKQGYEFAGWMADGCLYGPGDIEVMGSNDIVLTAEWSRITTHHVIYNTRGGSDSAPLQDDVREGTSFEVKAYGGIKDGYVFDGWMYNNETYLPGDEIQMGNANIMLNAKWTSLAPEHEDWHNPMLMFFLVITAIALVVELCTHIYMRKH